MSNPVSAREALTQEVQQLGTIRTNYIKIKGVAKSCARIAFSAVEAVALGGFTPLKALAYKSAGIVGRLLLGQARAEGYTHYGKRVGAFGETATLTIGQAHVNRECLQELQDTAKKMKVRGCFSINPGADCSTTLMSSMALSFSPEKVVECHPLFFYSNDLVAKSTDLDPDPQHRRAQHALTSNRAYVRFVASSTVASMKNGTFLVMKVAQLGTFYIAKVCADNIATNRQMDPQSWTYAIFTGLCAKVAADSVNALVHRFMTYRSDRAAVRVTEDVQSAVECFKVLKAFPDERNLLEKVMLPMQLLFTEEDKLLYAIPSHDARIRNLDPEGVHARWELPVLPELDDKREVERLTRARSALKYENQFAIELHANGRFLLANTPRALLPCAKTLAKVAAASYVGRYFGLQSVGLSLLAAIVLHSYPAFMPWLPTDLSVTFGTSQARINALRERMGIKKPVHVQVLKRGSGDEYAAMGVGIGPGHALVQVPFHRHCEQFEGFILSHEMAHLKHNDNFKSVTATITPMLAVNLLLDALGYIPETHLQTAVQGFLALMTAYSVKTVVTRRFEAQADITAINAAPAEERALLIEQGITCMHLEQSKHVEMRYDRNALKLIQLWRKIQISPEGDFRFDFDHPALSTRIKALEALKSKIA